eukprot:1916907-Lingulodinium_polyedra.AAC.1
MEERRQRACAAGRDGTAPAPMLGAPERPARALEVFRTQKLPTGRNWTRRLAAERLVHQFPHSAP